MPAMVVPEAQESFTVVQGDCTLQSQSSGRKWYGRHEGESFKERWEVLGYRMNWTPALHRPPLAIQEVVPHLGQALVSGMRMRHKPPGYFAIFDFPATCLLIAYCEEVVRAAPTRGSANPRQRVVHIRRACVSERPIMHSLTSTSSVGLRIPVS